MNGDALIPALEAGNPSTAALARQIRKAKDRLNFVSKRVPGRQRLYRLDEIANIIEHVLADPDECDECDDTGGDRSHSDYRCAVDHTGWAKDALFLKRLAFDLHEMREELTPSSQGRWFARPTQRP